MRDTYDNRTQYPMPPLPRRLRYGKKCMSDYGSFSYQDLLVRDSFGNTYDPSKEDGDWDNYLDDDGRWRRG